MSHIHLPHDQEQANGSWWRSGSGYISIRCPLCGRSGTLRDGPEAPVRSDGTRGHDIAADGTVSPSVVCPNRECTWHVFVILDGWTA